MSALSASIMECGCRVGIISEDPTRIKFILSHICPDHKAKTNFIKFPESDTSCYQLLDEIINRLVQLTPPEE